MPLMRAFVMLPRPYAPGNDFLPSPLVVLLHDRGDEDPVRVLLLEAPEFIQHRLEGSVTNKLKVLPPAQRCASPGVRLVEG
eukprot:1140941-Pelagomonas_calceolata.AAC.10